MPLLRPFWWENMDDPNVKGQMLKKLILYPPKKFQIYPGPSMRSKTDKCEYLRGPTQKIFDFFFSGLHTSSMNGFCKNWKWLVILLLKSQSTQCEQCVEASSEIISVHCTTGETQLIDGFLRFSFQHLMSSLAIYQQLQIQQ